MSWSRATREAWWAEPAQDWDIIVIGGGIMGAGILR
jgi:glycerol-3-phosphate dehydrogenase